jgi:tetratricopeptide (TPR) repeat protein
MRPLFPAFILLVLMLPLRGAWAHGAYHELLQAMTREVDENPQDARILLRRAALHLSHDEWTSALIDLELVDRLKPEKVYTGGLRGQALNQGRQWNAALTVLKAHLSVVPGDADALFERGRARFHLGDADAAEDFRASLSVASSELPDSARVLEATDAVRLRDGSTGAAAFIEQIIATHRTRVESAVFERALMLAVECGAFDRALQHIDALQRQAPRPEPWMARRASVLTQARRAADATAAWVALRDRLLALPSLERGTPLLSQILAEAQKALGVAAPAPVVASPLSAPTPHTTSTPSPKP